MPTIVHPGFLHHLKVMVLKKLYWNINDILPYQRNFNMINGERSIGKTYTTQKWVVDRCIKRDSQFVYIVRTQMEKKEGVFQKAFEKVELNEFRDHEFSWDTETLSIDGELKGFCIALSETQKFKKRSFPLVDYIIFDEYMIEEKSSARYISGWNEPDLLLSLYQTIDRDEDRVKVFMLGNNTSFYNPYHIHKAFNVKPIKRGGIWVGDNVLYQYAEATEYVKDVKEQSKFSKMIKGTKYGDYASDGKYIEDKETFLGVHDGNARYQFTIIVNGMKFGVYYGMEKGLMYISEKYDEKHPFVYALTLEDHSENVSLTKIKRGGLVYFSKMIKMGLIRYESMLIRKICEKAIYSLI